MKSIHTFDVFAPTDEQEEAMNKKRGGHYRRGKNKEMDYFIECATSLFPNNHYSRFTPIYDTTKEFYQLITSPKRVPFSFVIRPLGASNSTKTN